MRHSWSGVLRPVQLLRLVERQDIGFGGVVAEPFVTQRVAPHDVVPCHVGADFRDGLGPRGPVPGVAADPEGGEADVGPGVVGAGCGEVPSEGPAEGLARLCAARIFRSSRLPPSEASGVLMGRLTVESMATVHSPAHRIVADLDGLQ